MPTSHFSISHIARTYGYSITQISEALLQLGEEPSLSIDGKPFFCQGTANRVWGHLTSKCIYSADTPVELRTTAKDPLASPRTVSDA